MHPESGFWIAPNWSEIEKMTMTSFSLFYWSKFYFNIITSSVVKIIFFYKGLTRNPEIGNNPVWVI